MNVIEATKLMLTPDQWEHTHGPYADELQMKDGNLRFYSDSPVRLREKDGHEIVYEIPFIAWLWIAPLARLLRKRVDRRDKR